MKLTFIIGAEGSFKEDALVRLVHKLRHEHPEQTLLAANKIDLSNIDWYGTKPVWAQLDRIDKVIQNNLTIDDVIMSGWHLPELMEQLITIYPDATFTIVKPLDGLDTKTLETVTSDVTTDKLNEIISKQNTAIDKFISDHGLILTWELNNTNYETATFTKEDL